MFYKETTKIGYISIDKAVIIKIILENVKSFSGIVTISKRTGKIIGSIAKFGRIDEKNHIEINIDSEGIDVRMYVVIRFGTSISIVTEKLIASIRKDIENLTGIPVKNVAIKVTGMVSKHLTKRNIEIKG